MYTFANILFSGHCNANCPFCIGKQINTKRNRPNLNEYPLQNVEKFIEIVRTEKIHQIVFTGSNTDPLLYCHNERLLDYLREKLPKAHFSLHTNGRLAQEKINIVNRFDKICLSLPSFDPTIYQAMMGVPKPPDLPKLLAKTNQPIKLSCIVTAKNAAGMESFLRKCKELKIKRIVLRKLFGEKRAWKELLPFELGCSIRKFFGSPVYKIDGIEVTLWDFAQTRIKAINLFSSGEISKEYHLIKT